jgi:hypothetical protein
MRSHIDYGTVVIIYPEILLTKIINFSPEIRTFHPGADRTGFQCRSWDTVSTMNPKCSTAEMFRQSISVCPKTSQTVISNGSERSVVQSLQHKQTLLSVEMTIRRVFGQTPIMSSGAKLKTVTYHEDPSLPLDECDWPEGMR